jgi:hypothetical protein
MCTIDDILDWEEDYNRCRFTYPLQTAFDRLGIVYDHERHEAIKIQIFRALCYGRLYHELDERGC